MIECLSGRPGSIGLLMMSPLQGRGVNVQGEEDCPRVFKGA